MDSLTPPAQSPHPCSETDAWDPGPDPSRLNEILAADQCALWEIQPGMDAPRVSASFFQLLGFSSPDPSRSFWDHVHPLDRQPLKTALTTALEAPDSPVNISFRALPRSGKPCTLTLTGGPAPRRPRHLQGIIRTADGAVQTQDDHVLINALPGMLYRNRMVDGKWEVEYVNDGVTPLLGFDRDYFMAHKDELYGRIIGTEDRTRVWDTIIKAYNDDKPFELVYRIRTADNSFKWVWEKGRSICSPDGALTAMEGFVMDITPFKHRELLLQSSLESVNQDRFRFGKIIGKSPKIQKVYQLITAAGASSANTIIYGESGTGKELVARAIHQASDRKNGPMIVVNCGAIPRDLMESEFFGHKRGAFTGAQADKEGFLAAAHQGTLFLDEVGEISLELQVKLLRALDGYGYTPVGSRRTKQADIRIIAATNRNLEERVAQRKMRQDFFYRIHIVPIHIPPLRERLQDIPLLTDHFLEKYSPPDHPVHLPQEIAMALQSYHWPGNVRELENIIQRYVVLGEMDSLVLRDSPLPRPPSPHLAPVAGQGLKQTMEQVEKQVILTSLEQNQWRRNHTAAALGITPRTLYRKMQHHRIG